MMNINIWLKTTFSITKIPDWNCPSCHQGKLALVEDKFYSAETAYSVSLHSYDEWEPEFIIYRFSGMLKCASCSDFITFLGTGVVDHPHYYDDDRDEYVEEYNDVFTPLYFNPPLHIFNINENCPKEIQSEITDSFKLFWSDLPSCANKIRTTLEMLMNQQKVKKTYVQRGKRPLPLHKRIEEFRNTNSEIADYLLAIKWIGNTGSHTGKLEKIDILEAYELLEHSLNKLFENTEKKLKKMAKEINKRRGARKRNGLST